MTQGPITVTFTYQTSTLVLTDDLTCTLCSLSSQFVDPEPSTETTTSFDSLLSKPSTSYHRVLKQNLYKVNLTESVSTPLKFIVFIVIICK